MRKTASLFARVLLGISGPLLVAFAIHRWVWYSTIPKTSSLRWCANCAMAAIGVPVELGLVGCLFILFSASRGCLPLSANHLAYWALVVVGACSVIGAPLFALGFIPLFCTYAYHFVKSWLWPHSNTS
jgi:hypothetical protein